MRTRQSRPIASAQTRIHRLDGLTIIVRPISELKLNRKNPRDHSARQIRQIAESIRVFGFNAPILVDTELRVIAGHGRVLAARRLGLTEVPTIRLSHLSEVKAVAYMLTDNRVAENATWDDRRLAQQLKELTLLDLDFELEITGFEVGDIDLKIASLEADPERDDPADTPIKPDTTATISRFGDLWLLGRHRVLCGDVLDTGALQALLGEERAAIVFTDPPLCVPSDAHATGPGDIDDRRFARATGASALSPYAAFLAQGLRNQVAFCSGDALVYVCANWRCIEEVLAACHELDFEFVDLCIGVKKTPEVGWLHASQHELVFLFRTGGERHRSKIMQGRSGRKRNDVRYYPDTASSLARKTGVALPSTVKRVALVADALLDSTKRGEIVLDGFVGTGTTIVAAERSGRRCYGIELEPAYVDSAIGRWQKLTGGMARHAVSGRSFDDLAREAEVANAG